jgi:hypothetical protein
LLGREHGRRRPNEIGNRSPAHIAAHLSVISLYGLLETQVKWRALDKLVREYYSSLVSEAPPDLIEALGERMAQLTDPAEYWRRLAEQARREAERKTNARSRQVMITLALTYDRLANEAEKKKPPSREPSG